MKTRTQLIVKNKYNEVIEEEIKWFSKSYASQGIKKWFSSRCIWEYKVDKIADTRISAVGFI